MRQLWLRRPGAIVFLFTSICLWGAVTLRWITEFVEQQHPLTWAISAILLLFGILMIAEPLLTRRSPLRAHLYLVLQTGLVFLASLLYFELDFFALLYVPICGQAVFLLPRRAALTWLGILVGATAVGQTIQFGWPASLSFILLYTAALIFVAALVSTTLAADKARRHSDQLLTQLATAHAQLQTYADQAEALAIANERNRLARDLHDSVAQTLYGLGLRAEVATRRLAAGQYDAVADDLNEIREDAQQTLQETRLLIFELRPPALEKNGLTAALRALLEAVEARSGVGMHLNLQEMSNLPERVETSLYRIAQEALNNIARYAQATELHVHLIQNTHAVMLTIIDNGVGFDKTTVAAGSVGLQSMRERAEQLNGRFSLESAPHQGTKIHVEIPL